jgi:hypothetical protein
MMELVPLTDFHKEWVQARTQHPWVEDSVGLVVLDNLQPLGAVVLDSFTDNSATVHFCCDKPRGIHKLVIFGARMAFVELGLECVFAGIPSTNTKAINLANKLGFQMLGEMPNAISHGIDRTMMILEKENCSTLLKDTQEAA